MASSATNEALLRQILVSHERLDQKVESLGARVDGVQSDAREARDAARESAAATKAQDIPAQIEKLRGQVEKMATASRTDLVNVSDRITREMREGHDDHEARIEKLEAARNRLAGATGLLGWLSRHAPWLLTATLALAALFGIKDHH